MFKSAANRESVGVKNFLQDKGLPNSILRWLGNLFDVRFQNPSLLFVIGDGILECYTKVVRPCNNLQHAYKYECLDQCPQENFDALDCCTRPSLNQERRQLGKISQSSGWTPLYKQVRRVLQEWREDPMSILEERTVFGHEAEWDKCWAALTDILVQDKEDENNLMTTLVDATVSVMNKQLSSKLPGGDSWDPSPEMEEAAESCSANQ